MRHANLPAGFFSQNRARLRQALPPGSLACLWAGRPMLRNQDQQYPFRVNSNFFYLTGVAEPGSVLLLKPASAGDEGELLFLPPLDEVKEKWEGPMLKPAEAKAIGGVKKTADLPSFEGTLFAWQRHCDALFAEVNQVFPQQALSEEHLFLQQLALRLPGLQVKKLEPLLLPLRAQKDPCEQEAIKNALGVTRAALSRALQVIKPGVREFQVEAELLREYLWQGCDRLGFDSIVAAGANACVLHYTANKAALQAGDLVLIDNGGELGMYTGDITRVFPVDRRFTPAQATAYQAVLEVNQEMCAWVKAGQTWAEIGEKAQALQKRIYAQAGLLADQDQLMQVALHRIGHSLGLDVHDPQKPDQPLPPGAVITIEPGVYLKDRGIGIRIEDNLVLTENGAEVLSDGIPKEIPAILQWMEEA